MTDRHAILRAKGASFALDVFNTALAHRVEVDALVAAVLHRRAPTSALIAARALLARHPDAARGLERWPAGLDVAA